MCSHPRKWVSLSVRTGFSKKNLKIEKEILEVITKYPSLILSSVSHFLLVLNIVFQFTFTIFKRAFYLLLYDLDI
jgi:hypothetical protein